MDRFIPCLAGVLLIFACTTVEPTWVQLDQSVHFLTPAGTDIVVKPGTDRLFDVLQSTVDNTSPQFLTISKWKGV